MQDMAFLAGVKVGTAYPARIMGVINVSPESFYKGSVHTRVSTLSKTIREMDESGADFIDVGAMSTAPYLKTQITEAEEIKRLQWAIKIIKKNSSLPVSADTMRPAAARAALEARASILNDVSGFSND